MLSSSENNTCKRCSSQDTSYCDYCEVSVYNDSNKNTEKNNENECLDIREYDCYENYKTEYKFTMLILCIMMLTGIILYNI